MKRLVPFFISLTLISCLPINTSNPEKAFKYWSGYEPPKGIELIKGEYYQSPHFTLEYELFLKFKPTKNWWNGYITENKLEIDNNYSDWLQPLDPPNWFQPAANSVIYRRNDTFQRSRYIIEYETGICYIYETVGM